MRILLFSRAFSPAIGGIERFAETLAQQLGERGHTVNVVTRTVVEGREPERPYRVERRPSLDRLLALARSADIVHANGLSLRGVGLGLSTRRRVVVTHQGHQAVCPAGACMPTHGRCSTGPSVGPCRGCPERGSRATVDVHAHHAACTRIVAANVSVSEYLRARLGLPRSRTIYSPVSGEAFAAATDAKGEDGLVVFAGRLVAEKGLDVLLRALALVPDARLEVVGDGPMLSSYRDLTQELGLSLRVTFAGAQPFAGVADAYARAAVVCVPTQCEEAFGFAAAEAMAMSRPIVVTPSGALTELGADDQGFVTATRGVEDLAAMLESAIRDEEERARRAAAGHAFASEQFHVSSAAAAYEVTYQEAVA